MFSLEIIFLPSSNACMAVWNNLHYSNETLLIASSYSKQTKRRKQPPSSTNAEKIAGKASPRIKFLHLLFECTQIISSFLLSSIIPVSTAKIAIPLNVTRKKRLTFIIMTRSRLVILLSMPFLSSEVENCIVFCSSLCDGEDDESFAFVAFSRLDGEAEHDERWKRRKKNVQHT